MLQVLTSDTTAPGAALLFWLRARWRIENAFKYATAHHGIDALADYVMDIGPDQARVANPARLAARQQVAAAEAAVATAERGLAQALTDTTTSPRQKNTALPTLHDTVEGARAALATAREALAPIPAQLPATELDPDAKRARPRLERRGLQMVLRLLAYNAEAWLAEHLNTYLADPNEFRAITRHLLHLSGQLAYTRDHITVTLDRPDTPRVAHALELLTEELNATPVHLPGDRRRLSYRVSKP